MVALISWRMMMGLGIVAVPMLPTGEYVERPAVAEAEPRAVGSVDDRMRKSAERFVGAFAFVGGEAERKARDAAIEDVVSDMGLIAKPIARDKLRAGNEIAERLEITVDGDVVSVSFDGRPFVAALDGSKKRVTGILGDQLDYHVEIGGAHLRQVFTGDRGGRSNSIRRAGGKVAIDVKVTSSRLPKPLQYRLTYAPK